MQGDWGALRESKRGHTGVMYWTHSVQDFVVEGVQSIAGVLSNCGALSLGCRVFTFLGLGPRGLGLGVQDIGFRVQGLGLGGSGFQLRI